MRIKVKNKKKYQYKNRINTLPNKIRIIKENKEFLFSSSEENTKREHKNKSNRYSTKTNPSYYKINDSNDFNENERSFGHYSNYIEENNGKFQEINPSSILTKPKVYKKLIDINTTTPMKIKESKNIAHKKKNLKIENPTDISLDYFKSSKLTSRNGSNTKIYKKNLHAETRPKLYVNPKNIFRGSLKKHFIVKSNDNININTNTNTEKHISKTSGRYLNSQTMKNFYITNPIAKTVIEPLDVNFESNNGAETYNNSPIVNYQPNNVFSMKFMKRPAVYHPNEREKNKIRIINNNDGIKIFNISFNEDVMNHDEEEIITQKQKEQEKRKKKSNKNNVIIKNKSINQRKFKGNFRNLNATEVLKFNTLNSIENKAGNLNLSEEIELEEIEDKKRLNSNINEFNFEEKEKILIKKRPVKTENISRSNFGNELLIVQKDKNNIISEIKILDFKNLEDINNKLIENNFCVNNEPIIFFSNNENKKLVNKIKKLKRENNNLKGYLMNNKFDMKELKFDRQVSFGISDENDDEEEEELEEENESL